MQTAEGQTIGKENIANVDEITQYQNARFVSASEACHRIYQYLTHAQYPPTERVPIHCKDEQSIIYDEELLDKESIDEILLKNSNTKLTEYFEISKNDPGANQLYYYEMPTYYTWNAKLKQWARRIRGEKYSGTDPIFLENLLKVKENVGRMYFVHPNEHERFAVRTLLLYRKGCHSFEELKTVNGIICTTNKEAVIQLGLAEDNNEWFKTLEEATLISTPL